MWIYSAEKKVKTLFQYYGPWYYECINNYQLNTAPPPQFYSGYRLVVWFCGTDISHLVLIGLHYSPHVLPCIPPCAVSLSLMWTPALYIKQFTNTLFFSIMCFFLKTQCASAHFWWRTTDTENKAHLRTSVQLCPPFAQLLIGQAQETHTPEVRRSSKSKSHNHYDRSDKIREL